MNIFLFVWLINHDESIFIGKGTVELLKIKVFTKTKNSV